jgi:glycosyltransferase involved in cell wall biosynthesis
LLLARERIDVLHSLHTFLPFYSPAARVVTIYDLMNELFPEYEAVRASRPFRVFKHLVRTSSPLVVAISRCTAADLERMWGLTPSQISVVYLAGPDPRRAEIAHRRVAGGAAPVVLTPFNLEPRKNLTALLRAMAEVRRTHPSVRLVLYGRAAVTEERESSFHAVVEQLGLTDAIELTGHVTDDTRVSLFQKSALFVFPSLYEGFGLPVLEAMAAGCCVVARDRSAMTEVMGDTGVQVDTADVASLERAIRSLLDDPARRESLGLAARRRALQFTVEAMAANTYSVYMKALGRL